MFAIYGKKDLALIMRNTIKSNIISITLENIKQLLTISIIEDPKYQRKFLYFFIMFLNRTIIL